MSQFKQYLRESLQQALYEQPKMGGGGGAAFDGGDGNPVGAPGDPFIPGSDKYAHPTGGMIRRYTIKDGEGGFMNRWTHSWIDEDGVQQRDTIDGRDESVIPILWRKNPYEK